MGRRRRRAARDAPDAHLSAAAGTGRRAIVVATGATVACALPLFVTVALSVQLADDLGFDPVGVGSLVAIFFGVLAATSVHMGRVADRLGASRSLRISTAAAAVSALGIATFVRSWSSLALWFLVAGVAASLAQPAANRLLVLRVRPQRLGTAFGLKQSAPAVASMLAGICVPTIALTLGWRWTYLVVALVASAAALAVRTPRGRAAPSPVVGRAEDGKPSPLPGRSALVLLMGGFGAALASSSAVLAFYVDAAVRAGGSHGAAGVLFAAASAAAIVARLGSGVACDRFSWAPLRVSAVLVAAGALGIGLLATERPSIMGLGVAVALAGTWGFPGVFWLALLRAYRAAPGRVTGAMAPAAVGGIVGPVGFGVVAARLGYPTAWVVTALLALGGAVLVLSGERRLSAVDTSSGANSGRHAARGESGGRDSPWQISDH